MTGAPWAVVRLRGTAAELHARELDDPVVRAVWVLTPDRPALVLGSTQSDELADPAVLGALGVDRARRRSGGGAVLLDPIASLAPVSTLWIDLVLPRADPLWTDDVGESMAWLGEAWRRALVRLGSGSGSASGSGSVSDQDPVTVHRGALERTPASRLVCFAGVGPGEVLVGDRKVVGISQRRTRAGARFQCVVHLADGSPAEPSGGAERIVDLLREPAGAAERAALAARLRDGVGAVAAPAEAVVAALVSELPPD